MIHQIIRGALVALVIATTTSYANAALLIDAGPNSNLQPFLGGDYVAGTEFTTVEALTINSLAWLDAEGDGLLFNSRVGLWDTATEGLMTSVLVTPSSSTLLSAHGTGVWYLENITPITIGPGTYRVAGDVGPNGHNALSNDRIGNGVTLSSGYTRTSFPSGGFNYPGLSYSSRAIRASLSAGPAATAVPEPSSLAIFSIITVGAAVVGLRRGRRRANGSIC